jgi:hypothetical protein
MPCSLSAAVMLMLTVLCIGSCTSGPLSVTCVEDAQCGSGFDCYQKKCTKICTKSEQCSSHQTCERYRCLDKIGKHPPRPRAKVTTTAKPHQAAQDKNDLVQRTILSELRAIRVELSKLRQQLAPHASQSQRDSPPALSAPNVRLPKVSPAQQP